MRLVSYKLTVPVTVGTMDRYFHIMFKNALGGINGSGAIVDPDLGRIPSVAVKVALELLTKQHPVAWEIETESMGRKYRYNAKEGKVKRERLDENGDS